MKYKGIINPVAKPSANTYEDMIKELGDFIEGQDKESQFELPKLNEFFSLGYSCCIIEGSYHEYYDGEYGKKLLSILKSETELVVHNAYDTQRGTSDYGFHTTNHCYVFKYNNLFLTIQTSTPRSEQNIRYEISCSDVYKKP